MASVGETVAAPVKSAWASKVNWIAGVGSFLTAGSAILTYAAPLLPPPYGVYATTALAVVTGLATIWARTFKTTSVLAPSTS
jgi:hypothetical protein